MRRTALLLAAVLALVCAAPASANQLLSQRVTVGEKVERSCIARALTGGGGYATRSVSVPEAGLVTARLAAGSGDWDVALFDSATGQMVAGSAFFGASEVAQGFAAGGQRLTVQACRRSGGSRTARLTVESTASRVGANPPTLSLVRVMTPTRARKDELTSLGLDLTEHGRDGFVEVVLHGPADARRLREAKFTFTTEVADLAEQAARDRAADRRYASSNARSALPSGRTGGYRRLPDYGQEMKELAAENPRLVKPITLPFKTATGMSVEGIEVTADVNQRDGKPVFLHMGGHHAREWPSAEHTIEWAYELVNGYRADNPRVRRLMSSVRTIIVPLVNPEGFNVSREAGETLGQGGGRPGGANADLAYFLSTVYEYQRKNCRVVNPDGTDPPEGDCSGAESASANCANTGLSQFGVDPNRNYGGFWGGPGATAGGPGPFGVCAQDYRGSAPFSEPETRNVRALVSTRHVTTLITNHTYSNLVLRPPAIRAQGPTVDEPVYKALGDSMASHNAYESQPSYDLYDTSGGTEDWTYYATGGLGFTFEIGPDGFHPTFSSMVAEYEGAAPAAGAGKGGNREAYFKAMENAARDVRHSVVGGEAPAGAVLRLKKNFKTKTSPVIDVEGETGDPILFDDTLDTTIEVPASGRYEWHINPSTRPIIAQGQGRPPTGGSPSPPIAFENQAAAQPPCPQYYLVDPAACPGGLGQTEHVFEIPANGPAVDNGFANVKLDFDEAADLDLEVFKADAEGNPTGEPVASAASSANPEQTILGPDPEPGRYVARVINFAAGSTYDLTITFTGPKPYIAHAKETWTMTCEGIDGKVAATRQVLIERGEVKTENFGAPCAKVAAAAIERRRRQREKRDCLPTRGGVKPRRMGTVQLGRTQKRQRRILGGKRLKSRRGIDRYCVRGGGGMRVGYPTRRLATKISNRLRNRVRRRAILAISSSRRFRVSKVRVGTQVGVLRKRVRGETRYRVGRNVWFTARGKRSRLLFSTRGGRVRQLGLGDKALTSTRLATFRFLRAWDKRGL